MKTSILIRPAARGGKYLGPDAATATGVSAAVALLDPNNLNIIKATLINATLANAGPANLMDPVSRSQPYATDATTVDAIFTVDINEPKTYLVAVFGPMKFRNQARATYTEITILPGVDVGTTGKYPEGIVVEIPGLCIGEVTATLHGNQLSAFAEVTMMCGCKIAHDSSWSPSDFKVKLITQTQKGHTHDYDLDFDTNPANPSSFIGSWPNKKPDDPIVKAWISAYEPKIGNQGIFWIMGDTSPKDEKMLDKVLRFIATHNN